MASKVTSRDTVNLVLAGVMAIGLVVAMVGGLVAIIRFGQPDGATATWVAETSAWICAAAFLITFFLALRDLVQASPQRGVRGYSPSSCPALCRASTSSVKTREQDVDGRDKPGHAGAGCATYLNSP